MENIFHISEALEKFIDKVDKSFEEETQISDLTSGFSSIDFDVGGFLPGELAIVGGAPATGKTAFLTNIASNIALSNGKPVLFISSEWNETLLALRFVSLLGQIPCNRLRRAYIHDDDWPGLADGITILRDAPIFFANIPELAIGDIEQSIASALTQHGIEAVMIDGLQNIRVNGAENKAAELASVTRDLKSIALKHHLLIMACSHLNRYHYQRVNKRPILSDLLGAGSVEHDADFVFFIYRDEIYNEDSQFKDIAEVILAKNRNGITSTSFLNFVPDFLQFKDME